QNGQEGGGWPKPLGGPLSGPPAVGDLDGDGFLDIAVVLQNGSLFGLTSTGSAKSLAAHFASPPIGGPVLAEMDTTGQLSVIVATQDGSIHAIRANGTECPGFPVVTGQTPRSGAFTFIGYDNFPRVGILTQPGGAQIYYTYGLKD